MSARRQTMLNRIATVVFASATFVSAIALFAGTLPAVAGAYATVAPQPQYSAAPGLPDGRVYEEVSPPNKYSNEAGARAQEGHGNFAKIAVANADGNSVFFGGYGGLGEAVSGIDDFFVAQRSPSGWSTRSALPRAPLLSGGPGAPGIPLFTDPPKLLAPSADLTHTIFTAETAYAKGAAPYGIGEGGGQYGWVYLSGPNPLLEPAWLTRPVEAGLVQPASSYEAVPVGGTSDFSTVYFTEAGTVGLPEDASRAPHVAQGKNTWGFYQYRNGVLGEAGVLPDGSVSEYGAVPAALAGLTDPARYADPDQLDNEVSRDGLKAFFVSPDPRAGVGVPQLYVRKTASDGSQSTALVSQSQFPGHLGKTAPNGPVPLSAGGEGSSYTFGSPDGSHAFFASTDQLTSQAPSTTVVNLSDEGSAGGIFTLTANVNGVEESTPSLPYGASPAEVQSALEALDNVGPGHVTVGNGQVRFNGLEPAPVKLNADAQTFGFALPKDTTTFELTVEVAGVSRTTAQIADGASPAEVQAALEALGNVGPGNVTVTPITGGGKIVFSASVANQGASVKGSEGSNVEYQSFEYLPSYTLTVESAGVSRSTSPIAYSASAAQLQAALEALSNVGSGNVTVTETPGERKVSFATGVADKGLSFKASRVGLEGLNVRTSAATPVKYYDFNLNSESLTYLPNVSGSIVAAAPDGSSFLFENRESSPAEMERWSAGPDGGTVTPVAQLPGSPGVGQARTSDDGSVDLFVTSAPIAGFNDGGVQQIFRYDATSNELNCVSCAPAGVTPQRAVLSNTAESCVGEANGTCNSIGQVDNRGISADGDRVFFDTATPLVPQDTDGRTDVYEWESGNVFLVSSGTSSNESFFLDNSSNGSDVFLATVDGLVPGDTEGGYDVYDARIPHPGDNPPPSAVPCQGDVCQGPPSVPALLGEPSSETFNGLGNIAPEVKPSVKTKAKPKVSPAALKLSKALKACRKKPKGKRAACESRARKTYNRRGK